MPTPPLHRTHSLAKQLVQDELFDLTLYKAFHKKSHGELKTLLEKMILVEEGHLNFWVTFFHEPVKKLSWANQGKYHLLTTIGSWGGPGITQIILESIEVYGVKKYIRLWQSTRHDAELRTAIAQVLRDELEHEDKLIRKNMEQTITPESIRNIFFGFNDGSVEILGAVSGFAAAFGDPLSVLVAGITVAVAGSLSMAAGAFLASNSEREVQAVESGKYAFLSASDETNIEAEDTKSSLRAALIVGSFYFLGAAAPVLPFALGARTALPSILLSGTLILIVSLILAFISGMDIGRRIRTNLVIITATVGCTYAIGTLAKQLFGINL